MDWRNRLHFFMAGVYKYLWLFLPLPPHLLPRKNGFNGNCDDSKSILEILFPGLYLWKKCCWLYSQTSGFRDLNLELPTPPPPLHGCRIFPHYKPSLLWTVGCPVGKCNSWPWFLSELSYSCLAVTVNYNPKVLVISFPWKKEASFFPPFHWGALLHSPSAKVRKQKLVEASLDY